MSDGLLAFDSQLFQLIYQFPHPLFLVAIMEFLSIFGYFGIGWMVIGYAQKRFKKVFLVLSLVFVIVDLLLKFAFVRARPYPSALDSIFPWESYSFPSGHAAASFAAAYILTNFKFQMSNDKPARQSLAQASAGGSNSKSKLTNKSNYAFIIWSLAVLISFSRVYLGRHYVSDIAVGALIGWVIGKLVVKGYTIRA